MKRYGLAVLVALLVMPASAGAVTLVTPSGQPIGGQLQAWANESHTPTISRSLPVVSQGTFCPEATGCSLGDPRFTASFAIAVTDRDSLYFELGHQFDWQYLTVRDRRSLARFWSVPHARWWDSLESLQQGTEDGLEADFAAAYDDCAWGDYEIAGIAAQSPVAALQPPVIYPKTDSGTCKFIRRVAARHHR